MGNNSLLPKISDELATCSSELKISMCRLYGVNPDYRKSYYDANERDN